MTQSLKSRELKPSWKSSLVLELEASTPSAPALPEEELLSTGPLPERTSMERLTLLLLAIGIIPPIEPRPQFRVAQNLIRFVDPRHLLLRLLLWHMRVLIRMVLLRQRSVCALDRAVVGVRGNAEDFVVVFCF